MSLLREGLARVAGLFAGRRRDRELDEEVQLHLDMLTQEQIRRGLSEADARAAARRAFGGVIQMKEAYRDQRGLPFLETFLQDVKYGARGLLRTRAFTVAALATLALGIGANSAIFSVVNAVVFRPLPFIAPDRLVVLGDRNAEGLPSTLGYLTLDDYRSRARSFEHLVAVRTWMPTLVTAGEATRINALRVSWNYFDMLGVRPALGRDFTREDDRADRWGVLLISDGLWRRRFGADPDVVNRTVRMNDRDYRIVGVLPATFEPLISAHFYSTAEMWAPLGYEPDGASSCRTCRHLRAVGRIRSDATLETARAEVNAIRHDLARTYPSEYADADVAVVRLEDTLAGPVRRGLVILLAAVGVILLIACANVANLLLARGLQRTREMAVRTALGAGRARLVRQMLTESVMLAGAGGLLGLGLAAASLNTLLAMAPVSLPRLDQVSIDARVFGFALALSLATGLVFGLAPALRAAAIDPQRALGSGGRAGTGAAAHRTRRLLVIGDVALALVLLASAGLMLKSVARLMQVPAGFDPRGVLTLQFSLVGRAYAEDAAVHRFIERTIERVRALTGVEAAAVAGQIPMGGNYDRRAFEIEGRPAVDPSEIPSVERYSVTPEYFHVMRIPLLRGRPLTSADRAGSPPAMLIGETTARQLWPGSDPIGHRVRIGGPGSPWRTVVGVVGDVRHFGLDEAPTPQMYLPQSQMTDSFVVLTVRTANDPLELVAAIRTVVRELDPAVPVYDVAPLQALVDRTVAQRRFVTQLLGVFAALAVLLAAVGLYGVVAYSVGRRTREIGIRLALGARPADVLRLVLSGAVGIVGAGITVGLLAAAAATRFLDTLVFGVAPFDPATYAAAAGVLVLVALAAHWIPVRRALHVDPAIALRQE